MGVRYVDLQELHQFQAKSQQFCNHITELSELLERAIDAASGMLHDDVADKLLSDSMTSTANLKKIGKRGSDLMAAYLKKTSADIERWNALNTQG